MQSIREGSVAFQCIWGMDLGEDSVLLSVGRVKVLSRAECEDTKKPLSQIAQGLFCSTN